MPWASRENRAFRSAEKIARLREELAVIDEQVAALEWDAEDSHVRALVSENVTDRHDDTDAARHVAALRRARTALVERITRAEEKHRQLLARLWPENE